MAKYRLAAAGTIAGAVLWTLSALAQGTISVPRAAPTPAPARSGLERLSGQAPGAAAVDSGLDPDIEDLMKRQKRMQEQVEQLNKMNPLATDVKATAPVDVSKLPKNAQWLGEFMNKPSVRARAQNMAALAGDAEFGESIKSIGTNPNVKYLSVASLAIIVLFFFIKRRALAATDRLLLKLVIRLSVFALFVSSLLLASYMMLGKPFVTVVVKLAKAVI